MIGQLRSTVGDVGGFGDSQLLVDLIGNHSGEFHHFVEFVVGIDHGVVGGFQPHITSVTVDTLEAPGHELTGVQATPELLVFGAVVFVRVAERAVMFALDLGQVVAHGVQKAVIGRQHVALQVELDHGGRTHQRADQVLVLTGGFDGAGEVAGENRKTPDLSV
ncbi:hypothetical protein D3C73_1019290 [compost metagenome]